MAFILCCLTAVLVILHDVVCSGPDRFIHRVVSFAQINCGGCCQAVAKAVQEQPVLPFNHIATIPSYGIICLRPGYFPTTRPVAK